MLSFVRHVEMGILVEGSSPRVQTPRNLAIGRR
jgi:hypothetical protein